MSNKLVIIVLSVCMVFIIIMGAGLFVMYSKLSSLDEVVNPQIEDESEQAAEGAKAQGLGPIFSLEPFIVNLADEGGKRFIRVTMDLECQNDAITDEMTQRLPQIRDSILMILPTKSVVNLQSTEGKVTLRDEVLATINGLLKTGSVENIYFTEFVIQ